MFPAKRNFLFDLTAQSLYIQQVINNHNQKGIMK